MKENYLKYAYGIYLGFLVTGGLLLVLQDKGDFVLFVNQFHTVAADLFFKYFTYLGDGWIFAIVLIGSFFISYYHSLLLVIAVLIQTLIVQLMKRMIFEGVVRPSLFFDEEVVLNYVEGVKVHGYHSFPSGHTATAFAVATFLTIATKNRTVSVVSFLIAIGVGISRVYLQLHFLVDVYFGSIIGVISVLTFYIPTYRIRLNEKPPWNRSLLRK